MGLEGAFQVQVGGSEARSFDALWIAADCEHRVEGQGRVLGLYYVDGSSDDGRAWSRWLAGERARSLTDRCGELCQALDIAVDLPGSSSLSYLRRRIAEILHCTDPALPVPEGDRAVELATALLDETVGEPLDVPELARRVGLRQRDLSARFRRETGLTIRRYLLWARLKVAVSALTQRGTLTEVAHAAGFADAAHLSRTFVDMFGVKPSESVAASHVEVLPRPDSSRDGG